MGRKRINNVYRHFLLHEESHTSTCLLCFKSLNSVHGSNLMQHLKFMHKTEYEQILCLNQVGVPLKSSPPSVSANSNDDESQSDGMGVVVDVEKFFTMEKGTTRARCDVCQAAVERKYMMAHLKREHPKMLKPASEESDADDVDENLYQEVVYLYDSDSKSTNALKHLKMAAGVEPNTSQQKKAKQKTRAERDSMVTNIENRKRRRLEESTSSQAEEDCEELENFGKYITCLLKTVPKDLSTQLQMEIINLIMTAKIKNMSKPSTSAPTSAEKTCNLSVVDSCSFDQSVAVTAEEDNVVNIPPPSPESNTVETLKKE